MNFKTNIRCGGCVANISKAFENKIEAENWSVDTASPEKILTVNTDLSPDAVIKIVTDAGYKAELVLEG